MRQFRTAQLWVKCVVAVWGVSPRIQEGDSISHVYKMSRCCNVLYTGLCLCSELAAVSLISSKAHAKQDGHIEVASVGLGRTSSVLNSTLALSARASAQWQKGSA
jgi:hypothetical protein